MTYPTVEVKVDFTGAYDFAGANDDVTTRVRVDPGIVIDRGRDQLRSIAPPMAGSCDFELDNQSRDYSYENGASPVAGQLLAGRMVRIRATLSAVTYNVYKAFLDDVPQHPEGDKLSVSMPALGALSWLKGKKVSTSLYTNIRTDEAIGYLLDYVGGWPSVWRVLDTGQTTLAYWWLDEEDAFSALLDLLASEGPGAAIYEDKAGQIVFEGRHYRLKTARATTSQATLSDTSEPAFSGFTYTPAMQDITNVCSLEIVTRQVESSQKVWSGDATITLGVGEQRAIRIKPNGLITNAQAPVAGTDYTLTSGSLTMAVLSATSGASVVLTLGAGAGGAVLTGLQLRAQPVTEVSRTLVNHTLDTSASQAKYGAREYAGRIRPDMPFGTAQDLANAIVYNYKEPRPTVEVTLKGGTGYESRLTQSLTREISDRLTIVEPQTGLNGDVWLERIRHEILGGGRLWQTTFGCEKVDASPYGIFGTSKFGTGVFGF